MAIVDIPHLPPSVILSLTCYQHFGWFNLLLGGEIEAFNLKGSNFFFNPTIVLDFYFYNICTNMYYKH